MLRRLLFPLSLCTMIAVVHPAIADIWIDNATLLSLPMSGDAWTAVINKAIANWPNANVDNQDSKHDTFTLAGALAGVRLGAVAPGPALRTKAMDGLIEASDDLITQHWLTVSRNLGAYIIAADILRDAGVTDQGVNDWLVDFFTRQLNRNSGEPSGPQRKMRPFAGGSNANAHEGFVYAALAAWHGDDARLLHAWGRFRLYAGAVQRDCPTANCYNDAATETDNLVEVSTAIKINRGIDAGWAHDDVDPRAINPLDSTIDGHNVDGTVINDIRRGCNFQWPPCWTKYQWVGLEGFVPAGMIFARAGFPAFDVASRAMNRAVEAMWRLGDEFGENPLGTGNLWWDYDRARDIKYLNNWIYGVNHPYESPVSASRVMGYTDWTQGPSTSPPSDPCPGDIDSDEQVAVPDLLTLLGNWDTCDDCGNCIGDIDRDCSVTVADLLVVLGTWGNCPPGGGPPPDSLEDEILAAGLLWPHSWDEHMDCLTTGTPEERDNCNCWMHHYLHGDCNGGQGCPHPGCPDDDPFDGPHLGSQP